MDAGAIVSLLGAVLSVGAAVWIYRHQLRVELFEKRLAVYDATLAFLARISGDGRPPDYEQIQTFLRTTRNAEFLFSGDVVSALTDLYKKATEYRARYKVWEDTLKGDPDRRKRFDEQRDAFDAVHGMWEPIKSKFRKDLLLKRIW